MITSYISLDLETTGLDPKTDRIIEIGAVKVKEGVICDTFSTFVNPRRSLEERVTDLTGIHNEMLSDAPGMEDILPGLLSFLEDLPLLGHRILFDYSFLKKAAVNNGYSFEKAGLDTLKIARRFLPALEHKTLEYLCAHYHIAHHPHRALDDALATDQLYRRLAEEYFTEEEPSFRPAKLIYKVKKETPITKAQKERLHRILEQKGLSVNVEVDGLTRNEADRMIDRILNGSERKIMKHTIDTQFYPGWTRKAITFSIDDGNTSMDRKFKEILEPAGIRGTFNLCSHNISQMTDAEYREFYKGHEIANHCKYHPFAFADAEEYQISDRAFDQDTVDTEYLYHTDVEGLYHLHLPRGWRMIADSDHYIAFIEDCHRELEQLFGKGSVRGFVWPFCRQKNKAVEEHLAQRGYYGVRDSGLWGEALGFPLPEDRMPWNCTANHRNVLEAAAKYEAQPDDGMLKFFCLGVHSADFERDEKWEDLVSFAKLYGGRPQDYYYATVGEIFHYADALKQLVITEDCVKNPSDVDVYIRMDGENVVVKAGHELYL